ncbi:retroviral-like aspartic protease family protein [bacterium]|nr:retroviral-like aspartic protease family protein [bacterium]MBU1154190.1 retroviral-like aspartic protease family protein [bacterium]MBU2599294.1 retroviral-like aspartic protease family protein [bacterium]
MGEVIVEVELENFGDRYTFKRGFIKEQEIRSLKCKALVDTGAIMVMLPQDMVEELGLESTRKVIVTYANEQKEERDIAGGLTLKIGKRAMDTDCIVGPPGSEPLVGQIVLEELDLIVDCNKKTLSPRPESPYLPLLKLK